MWRRGPIALLTVVLGFAGLLGLGVPAPANAAVTVPPVPQPSWRVNGIVYATAIVGDTAYVGGSFTTATSPGGQTVPRANLAAFSVSTGEVLTGWRSDVGGAVLAMTTDQNSLWVGGSFTRIGGQTHNRVAKVSLTTGTPDAGFTANANGNVRALDVAANTLYAGGTFSTMNSATATRLAKLDATNGARDANFTATADGQVNAVKKNPATDVLYVAGDIGRLSGAARTGVGAVSATTGAATSLVLANTARPSLALDTTPDGSVLFAGLGAGANAVGAWNPTTGARLWRQTADGDIQAVRYFSGTVYFGFHDGFQGNTRLKLLAADATTGAIDPTFRPTFDVFWGIYAIAVTDQAVVAGGNFTNVSGVRAQGWVRFLAPTGPGNPTPTTVIADGASWRWRYETTAPDATWAIQSFDDSTWGTGNAVLGWGNAQVVTPIDHFPTAQSRPLAAYFRTGFSVPDPSVVTQLTLTTYADDGVVVYVNGQEVGRANMPAGTPTINTYALSATRTATAQATPVTITVPPGLLTAGTNVVAAETHLNYHATPDLTFRLRADLTTQP
jgi:hypothetical protein